MDTKEITKYFVDQVEEIFDDFLSSYGFSQEKENYEQYSFTVIYRNENRYLEFGCTLHPHDYPYYYYVLLGEGSDEFPESDWNSIPLWRFFEKSEEANHKNLYQFEQYPITKAYIIERLLNNQILLEKYGQEFLMGDLNKFKQLRAEQNKEREPYKINKPDNTGKYNTVYEKTSSQLKKKYSKK